MPENEEKLNFVLELKPCTRCGNPFMVKRSDDSPNQELICDNCIKLAQRKRELQIGVLENVIKVENQMEESINEMKNQLTVARGQFNKQFFVSKIKKRVLMLNKAVELIEKIEDTNDEKFIDEYKNLFNRLKNDSSKY